MMRARNAAIGWLLALAWGGAGAAAPDSDTPSERGRATVDVYPASVHDGGPDHARVQILPDDRLAVAASEALLLFDGAQWRSYPHPQRRQPLHEIALAPDGRFYTGFPDDLGYYQPDARGDFSWVSLNAHLPAAARSFGAVIAVLHDAERDWLVFVSVSAAFVMPRARPERISVLHPVGAFSSAYRVGREIWLQDTQAGVMRIAGTSMAQLESIPGTSGLRGTIAGIGAGPIGHLILLGSGELYRWNEGVRKPVAATRWPQWQALSPSYFAALRDGSFAIGFRRAPPWIIDAGGGVIERYDELASLPGVAPRGFAEDRMGGLWVSQANSLWRIDRGSATTSFGQREGVPRIERLQRWRGQLYLTSSDSLSRLRPAPPGQAARFDPVAAVDLSKAWAVEQIADRLVVVGNGIFELRDPESALRRVLEFGQLTSFDVSRFRSTHAYAGTERGVVEIDFSGTPPGTRLLPGSPPAVNSTIEVDRDTLWFAGRTDEIWASSRSAGAWSTPVAHDAAGLPPGPRALRVGSSGRIWVATARGVFVHDAASARFVQPPGLPQELRDRPVASVSEDDEGHLWAQTRTGAGIAWKDGRSWRWDESLLRPLGRDAVMYGVEREGAIAWVLRSDGLLRIDLSRRAAPGTVVLPRLSRIEDLRTRSWLDASALSQLGVRQRDLRLHFALPAFQTPGLNQLRSRLAGFETNWSEFGPRMEREYTNLPDGDFQLELEARDAFGRISTAAPVALSFPAPWWRSGGARAGYVAAALLLLWLAARFGARRRLRVLHSRQRELEAVVDLRTQELRQSNQQLAEQAERLTEVNRLKTRFFINVGHEFRTPLTLVLGPIDDLLRDARERLSARAREQLEMANRNAQRVLDLIVELLDVNRFEHGQMRLACVATDLRVLAQRVLDEHVALIDRHGHRASLILAAGDAYLASVDPLQIERCLSNLIGNAAKYMPRGGMIELALHREQGHILIEVRDQGRGIAPEALPHVFDRFFRAPGAEPAGGHGIGLALVREIVEAHAGTVAVSSELGRGSVFTLRLAALDVVADAAAVPAAEAPRPEPMPAPASATVAFAPARDAAAAHGAARPLVLVVDDHDDLRARVRDLLRDRFEVIEAGDGPTAWNLARDLLPDAIVCDVMMPGFDGIEFARRLRAESDTDAIALLLLTAKAGAEHAAAGLRAGADDYLAKPFDAGELIARIEALLARAQRLRLQLARARAPVAPAPMVETADQRWRRRLDEAIAARLDDPGFGVEQLALALHADRTQLFRRCKQLLGTSPSEYLRDTRLRQGYALLERRAGNVSEVAYAVGFDNLSSFTRAFSARYGHPPSRVPTVQAAG
jgi:signal transduction histidine kinase/DNA-binding response OmpR family regulator